METAAIAKRLVALCRKAQWETAQKELYGISVVSVEPAATPNFPEVTKGRAKIIKKGHTFGTLVIKIHSLRVSNAVVLTTRLPEPWRWTQPCRAWAA